ncbi:diadenylate cyclase CdaA [Desemzia incerta]|uniref:Diadenylate cyclase n=1 Tax=Desemzia incerta TaxID=82801 RepID=A0A1I5XJX7_9LACT|nr:MULTISPECIES: diadenylate cyclase CdaA [Desemzia]MCI3028968.1 diadenylate cyclase CdaA [Desemzia sp. C1]WHZ33040.1 diadenylate cyclase CdaA [Desemzia incerta]SFQ32234.1 diadenylate cyclase [Desemzia incerta]
MSIDWSLLFTWRSLINIIDVLIVAFFIYQLIIVVRGTRAVQLLKGIAIIVLIKVGSYFFQLQTVEWIVDLVIQWAVLALIIIFQPEMRRGLEHLGRGSLFNRKKKKKNPGEDLVSSILKSVQYMSKRRIGALIAIEMETGLEEYVNTGISMGADISGELLINTFIPNTPLHDGAVIIQDYKIASAASYLPLSESSLISKELGTRHRAAIGLSEVSDALTVVVSEETGGVSITQNGNLYRDLSREDFEVFLTKALVTEEEEQTVNPIQTFFNGFKKGASKK